MEAPAGVARFWHAEHDLCARMRGARRSPPQRALAAGEALFAHGDAPGRVFVLERGAVQVSLRDPMGSLRIVDLALPGDVLGFDGFASGAHAGDALVLRDSVVWPIEVDARGGMRRRERPWPELASLGAAQVLRAMRQTLRLRFGSVARLADCLLDLADKLGDVEFELPLSFQDLANYLDLRPETLSRALHDLQDRGEVQRVGGTRLRIDAERLCTTRAAPRPRQV